MHKMKQIKPPHVWFLGILRKRHFPFTWNANLPSLCVRLPWNLPFPKKTVRRRCLKRRFKRMSLEMKRGRLCIRSWWNFLAILKGGPFIEKEPFLFPYRNHVPVWWCLSWKSTSVSTYMIYRCSQTNRNYLTTSQLPKLMQIDVVKFQCVF